MADMVKMHNQYLFLCLIWLSHAWGLHYNDDNSLEKEDNERTVYEFQYGVRDPRTGDIKNQWEIQKGGFIQGEYSFIEPDGTIRKVQYTADKNNGFNAVVTREEKSRHSMTVKKNNFKNYREETTNQYDYPGYEEESKYYYPAYRKTPKNHYSGFEAEESLRKAYYVQPDVPANHSPVYTKISDYGKLLRMYKNFREQNSDAKKHKFDYGINGYLGLNGLNQKYFQKSWKG